MRIMIGLLCLFCLTSPAFGHAAGQSYIFLRVHDDSVEGRLEIRTEDLARVLELGLKRPELDEAALARHLPAIEAYAGDHFRIALQGEPQPVSFTGHRSYTLKGLGQFVVLDFTLKDGGKPERVEVDYTLVFEEDPVHKGLLVVEEHWKAGVIAEESNVKLIFGPGRSRQSLDLETGTSNWRGFFAFVLLGMEHILEGTDHVLFLAALLLPAVLRREDDAWVPVGSFRPAFIYVLKIVTLFTVAHSLTLTLGALDLVRPPSALVESIIALSITVAALEVFFPLLKDRIWLVVFLFGLFHGFGFAGILNEIGLRGSYVALSLLGFNLGVEFGQVVVIAVLFPLLYMVRNSRLYLGFGLKAGAVFLIVVSINWFLERALGMNIPLLGTLKSLVG